MWILCWQSQWCPLCHWLELISRLHFAWHAIWSTALLICSSSEKVKEGQCVTHTFIHKEIYNNWLFKILLCHSVQTMFMVYNSNEQKQKDLKERPVGPQGENALKQNLQSSSMLSTSPPHWWTGHHRGKCYAWPWGRGSLDLLSGTAGWQGGL